MKIDQGILNKVANRREPRTKRATAQRLIRQAQYKASNAEVTTAELFCPYCSNEVDDDSRYCFRCKEQVL